MDGGEELVPSLAVDPLVAEGGAATACVAGGKETVQQPPDGVMEDRVQRLTGYSVAGLAWCPGWQRVCSLGVCVRSMELRS